MTDRDPLRAIARRQRRDIGQLFTTLSDAIANATARMDGDAPMTERDRAAIMREVDAGLDVIFGAYRGDERGALRQLILRDTRAARYEPLDTAVSAWRSEMPRRLRELVEDAAMEAR